jgi:hypothetical protein
MLHRPVIREALDSPLAVEEYGKVRSRQLQLCDELGFDYGFCVEHHFRRGQSQGNIEVTGPPTLRFILDLLLRLGLL